MDMIAKYFKNIVDIIDKVTETQSEAMHEGAKLMADASLAGNNIFAFGCSHAGLLALELYYRTGGMAIINPIKAPGLNLDIDPATMTSQMERIPGYGDIIIDNQPIKKDDVIIIHSVSGRNTVTIDVALRSKEIGAKVIALTNLNTSSAVESRHPSGKNLYQIADIVLDNCGCLGDSAMDVPDVPEKVGPTSTAIGAAMLNAMMTQAVLLIAQAGKRAPVFVSANLDHGDAHNKAMLKEYSKNIFYMGHKDRE